MESEKASLEEVIQYLEANHGFLFSYKNEDVENIEVNLPSESLPIDGFLTKILQKEKIQFEIVNDNYIILTKSISKSIEKEKILLCGKVIDEYSNAPLEFANVYIEGTQEGSTTNKDGFFQFKVSPQPNDTLVISYVGYETQKVLAKDFQNEPCQTIQLAYFEFADGLIVIKEYLTDGIDLSENGVTTELQLNRIGALPGQVEPDVMKTIQFLPGIVSPDGSASNLNVRGGTSDQNLVLWEDIPMYHTAHYFGMISAFNPYIIEKASVYRGGFDADYGGRISSVIDLRSDDLDMTEHQFGAGVNLLNAFANGKVKLLKDKAALIFSFRNSYSQLWRTPTFESITRRIHQGVLFQASAERGFPPGLSFDDDFNFLDHNLKFSYRPSDKDEISFSWFYTKNDFNSLITDDLVGRTQIDDLYMDNRGLSFSWKHDWTDRFSSQILGVGTDYGYNYDYELKTENEDEAYREGTKISEIKDQQIHLINSYTTKNDHTFKVGYLLNHFDVEFEIDRKGRNREDEEIRSRDNTNLQVLYASFNTPNEKRMGTELGMRANYFPNIKERDGKNKFIEPRLRVWYNLNDDLRLYGNTGKYYQFLSQLVILRGDDSSIETPVWTLAGENVERGKELPVLEAVQHQLGVVYKKQGWLLDVQAYLKNVNGLTSVATGFDQGIANDFLEGRAKIRGVDILLKKRWKPFTSWASFSLSRSDHFFDEFFDKEFSAPNDIRSVFHWVTQWNKGPWECSLGWRLTSGSPYSLLENFEIDITNQGQLDLDPVVDNSFNTERLPSQHQLDASVVYNIVPANKKWKTVVGLSLYNIYDQTNIYNRSFFISPAPMPMTPPRLIYTDKGDVRFTPNVVLRVEW